MSKIKILFVCLGNICRSPLAEGIFNQRVSENGLNDLFEADSCGTAAYHIGASPDHRSRLNAKANGVLYDHKGRQLTSQDFIDFDLILPMDHSNLRNTEQLRPEGNETRVVLMRDYDMNHVGSDVPDPYYGGPDGFQEVFDILDRSVTNLINELKEKHI
jgi:protein-tyrosine phosphatase